MSEQTDRWRKMAKEHEPPKFNGESTEATWKQQVRAALREAADACDAKDAEIARLKETLTIDINKAVCDTEIPQTAAEKVFNFLLSKGNKPQTAKAILYSTGISRSALSQIRYKTHRDSFVSVIANGYSRKRLWALSDVRATEFLKHTEAADALRDPANEATT